MITSTNLRTRDRNLALADPDFDSVVLLAPFSGEDGDTTSTDLSNDGNTLTFNGTADLDGDIRKFGFTSFSCTGAVTFSAQALVDAGMVSSTAWTVEFWYRPDGTASVNDRIFQTADGDVNTGIYIAHDQTTAGEICFGLEASTSQQGGWDYLSAGTAITSNAWHHIALVRDGNDFDLYLDGTSVLSTTFANNLSISGGNTCVIGAQTSGSTRANGGHIENFRITTVARYTATFTPPERAFPTVKNFDAVTNGIELFLDAGSTASYPGTGNTWTDLSPNGNNATYQETTAPFDSDGGGCFDFEDGPVSANNVFTVPDDDSIEFGEVWTACIWIKTTDTTTDQYILNKHSNRLALLNGYTNGKVDTFINGSNPSGDQAMDVSLNTWEHFTWVKDLNSEDPNNFMYKNGSLVRSITASSNVGTSSETLRIGGTGTTSTVNFQGKIAILMMYKRALSAAEVLQNYNAQKSRFGL